MIADTEFRLCSRKVIVSLTRPNIEVMNVKYRVVSGEVAMA